MPCAHGPVADAGGARRADGTCCRVGVMTGSVVVQPGVHAEGYVRTCESMGGHVSCCGLLPKLNGGRLPLPLPAPVDGRRRVFPARHGRSLNQPTTANQSRWGRTDAMRAAKYRARRRLSCMFTASNAEPSFACLSVSVSRLLPTASCSLARHRDGNGDDGTEG